MDRPMDAKTGLRQSSGGYALGLLLAIYTFNFVDRTITNVVAEPIKSELGLADWQLGLMGGLAFAVFYTTLGLPIARIAERRSRVTIITLCLAVWSAMTALCGLSQNFGQLLAARVGVGVGEAGCTPAAQSLISDRFPPEKRAMALSVFVVGAPLGSLVGALAGGWVAQHYGWRNAFLVVGLPGLGLAILTRLTLAEPTRGTFDPPVDTSAAPTFGEALKAMMGNRAMRHLLAGACIAAFGAYGVQAFAIPFFIRSLGLSLVQAAGAFGLAASAAGMAGMMLGGYFATRLGAKDRRYMAFVPAIGLCLAAPLNSVAFLQTQVAPLAVLFLVGATFHGFSMGPTYAIINNEVDPRARATSVAILLFCMNLIGLGLGPLAVGALSDQLAASAYGPGHAADCVGHAKAVLPTCKAASATGLRYALCLASLIAVWAGFHYWRAGIAIGGEAPMSASRKTSYRYS
jgi:MFS family permease